MSASVSLAATISRVVLSLDRFIGLRLFRETAQLLGQCNREGSLIQPNEINPRATREAVEALVPSACLLVRPLRQRPLSRVPGQSPDHRRSFTFGELAAAVAESNARGPANRWWKRSTRACSRQRQ